MSNAKNEYEKLETKYNSVKDFLEQKKQLTQEIITLKQTIEDMQKMFKKQLSAKE